MEDHPENFCNQCGRENISWFVPSPLWNEVMRGPGKSEPVICPVCFAKNFEVHRGIDYTTWKLVPADYSE